MSSSIFKGTIHGKIIRLEAEPGLPDGQAVSVDLQPLDSEPRLQAGEGLRRACGAWAEDAEELDRYVDWSRQQRKLDRPEIGE